MPLATRMPIRSDLDPWAGGDRDAPAHRDAGAEAHGAGGPGAVLGEDARGQGAVCGRGGCAGGRVLWLAEQGMYYVLSRFSFLYTPLATPYRRSRCGLSRL